jgi:hypothetical protein
MKIITFNFNSRISWFSTQKLGEQITEHLTKVFAITGGKFRNGLKLQGVVCD